MRTIQLQYPDQTPVSKIIDDLTVLSRNIGQSGHRAKAAFDDEDLPEGIRSRLVQRSVPLAEVVPAPMPANQAIVTDGDTFAVTGGTITAEVVDNAMSFTFTPTP